MTSPDRDVPRHFIAGMICGSLALFTTVTAIAYYALVSSGTFGEPPHGLSPIWAVVVILLALVPIGLWCAAVAARPILDRIKSLEACVERASEDALKAANEAGYWRGVATAAKQDIENLATPAEVIKLVRDGRRNGNVG
ncbi:hypothetical protein O7626_40625 [Micromonospora sp. WMMD1102]|uniref:hypothetical protein n=1 Tax=Micromonospora sp. WMMD1102 TaxID=3016105 RepID=UPI0024150417|nr:hypothetical protein [Micromonospora sp. WMMD1102]MDG4792123.1 hypothetical protein [Micromonospora sp. WMMD1102]